MPEVLTQVKEEGSIERQSAQASNADLCCAAQAHYDKISTVAHEWHSAIPKAIAAYYADPERQRLEREVINAAREWNNTNDRNIMKCAQELMRISDAVDALDAFESQEQKK